MNGAASGVIAVETILGDGPTLKGNKADLVARLAELADADGKLLGHSTDARTNTVADGGKISAETSGTPAAGIGTALLFQAESQDEAPSDILRLGGVFDDVGTASEDSRFVVSLRVAGAALARVYEWVATTGFKAIFTHSNTADRTYTLPNATDNLVGEITTNPLAMVWLETVTLSASAEAVFTNLGSTYDEHVFQLIGVRCNTSTADFQFHVSIDNGSTYANSSYSFNTNGTQTTGAANVILTSSNSAVAANNGINGHLTLFKPHGTSIEKHATHFLSYNNTIAGFTINVGNSSFADGSPDVVTNAINAVRFRPSGGTLTGVIRHYGIKNGS